MYREGTVHSQHMWAAVNFLNEGLAVRTLLPVLMLGKCEELLVAFQGLKLLRRTSAPVRLGPAFLTRPASALGTSADSMGPLGHGDECAAGLDVAVQLVLAVVLVDPGDVGVQVLLQLGGVYPVSEDLCVNDGVETAASCW